MVTMSSKETRLNSALDLHRQCTSSMCELALRYAKLGFKGMKTV